jgi:hypothetical protein
LALRWQAGFESSGEEFVSMFVQKKELILSLQETQSATQTE